mmetsp:Transcript_4510/g.12995  ORF Transcript_4510/g.12995 Transcript_4510/m.12995 type:complete len:292 (-) Transcript_4510:551-1426(-)
MRPAHAAHLAAVDGNDSARLDIPLVAEEQKIRPAQLDQPRLPLERFQVRHLAGLGGFDKERAVESDAFHDLPLLAWKLLEGRRRGDGRLRVLLRTHTHIAGGVDGPLEAPSSQDRLVAKFFIEFVLQVDEPAHHLFQVPLAQCAKDCGMADLSTRFFELLLQLQRVLVFVTVIVRELAFFGQTLHGIGPRGHNLLELVEVLLEALQPLLAQAALEGPVVHSTFQLGRGALVALAVAPHGLQLGLEPRDDLDVGRLRLVVAGLAIAHFDGRNLVVAGSRCWACCRAVATVDR